MQLVGNGPGGNGSGKNEEFVMQQQLYDQQHEMKSFGMQDYTGFRNGMPAGQPQQTGPNSWDQTADSMNINYGPPPILAAGPPTGMPPGKVFFFFLNPKSIKVSIFGSPDFLILDNSERHTLPADSFGVMGHFT